MRKTLNLREVTDELGVSTSTYKRMIKDGRAPIKPLAGFKQFRFRRTDLDAFLKGGSSEVI